MLPDAQVKHLKLAPANAGHHVAHPVVISYYTVLVVWRRVTRLLKDGWTVVTRDRSLSAQWEHTIAVTEDGHDVLTQLPGDEL